MNRLLLTLALGVFAGALDLGVLSPALPAIGREFGVQPGDLAWVFTIYLLVTVLSIALASTLADRYGRRPVYLSCLALYPLHVMGAFYFGAAAVLGGIFVLDALRAWREHGGTHAARSLFRYSLLYLALMCAVMVVDRIVS